MDKMKKPPATTSSLTTAEETKDKVSESKSVSAVPKKHTDISLSRPFLVRMIQNSHLVWLDGSIDEEKDKDYRDSITQLQQVVNTVHTFVDVDECIDFITDIKEDNVLMVLRGALSHTIGTVLQDTPQVRAIYIISENKTNYEQWSTQWFKVKDVFTDIASICETLKQAAQNCDQNSVSMSFIAPNTGGVTQNLDELDQSFMYTQILKEILLTIDFEQKHFTDFVTYCREQFAGNLVQIEYINKLEKDYWLHEPIWWYTYQSFLFSMLNRALRTMEIDLIIKMKFFVCDLHTHITQLHSKQYAGRDSSTSFTVYRGQGLFSPDFHQMVKTKGGLMSFNNFLSTSLDREVSFIFADSNQMDPDLIGVLFEITIDPSIVSTPFANIRDVSYYHEEEEILFSMHSVFRIGQISQIDSNPRLWQVDLTLTSDNDPHLHALTEHIREKTTGYTGWSRLGDLMVKVGQFNQAEELYQVLLSQTIDEREIPPTYRQLAVIKHNQGRYSEALSYYEKSLESYQKTLPANHPHLGISYNSIGGIYEKMGEYSKALSYHEKSLEIYRKTLPPHHANFGSSYHNIGLVYSTMGEYSKALSYHEKSLDILQKTLPANHPDLATSCNNIGAVYEKLSDYSKALSYFEKALKIKQKTLPANHPDLLYSYNNIGSMYNSKGEYSKALSSHEKALEISQKTLSANHPELATSYNNIGGVYENMGEYSKALSYYEKALEIIQKTLLANHHSLATSYNNIGGVYENMGEYSKALSYYEKALEIIQKTLPANHPDLAASYNNIGLLYKNIGEFSKALSYYEKALENDKKTFPANHPSLATSYNNIGGVYQSMGEYSKALSYHEKALEIWQKTLPVNHPNFASSYNNIGSIYSKMSEYSKAVSYCERAHYILKQSLPANHPSLAISYQNIGSVYQAMGEYLKALSYYGKAVEIFQKCLPANHPNLAHPYGHMGRVFSNLGEHSKAVSYCERALDILEHSLPANHPHVQVYRDNLEYVKENSK